MSNEIINYLINNFNKFEVCRRELQKISRQERMYHKSEASDYLMGFFKEGIKSVLNNARNSFVFSISLNTVVLIHEDKYMHIQVYDTQKSKPVYLVKSLRNASVFSIHDFKNHGLTITNHLLHRYIQYFKKINLLNEKELHKDRLESELMIKLKGGKTKFSNLLTDTVYMVVDDMYFVLKINGKNTVSLVTMRPYKKTLELPQQLRKKVDIHSYKLLETCEVSKETTLTKDDIIQASDKSFVSKSAALEEYPKFNFKDYKVFGRSYIKLLKETPSMYVKGYDFNTLLNSFFEYNKSLKGDTCIFCDKDIKNQDFYTRKLSGKKIHKKCADKVFNAEGTQQLFENSGLSGLVAAVKQQLESEEIRK